MILGGTVRLMSVELMPFVSNFFFLSSSFVKDLLGEIFKSLVILVIYILFCELGLLLVLPTLPEWQGPRIGHDIP